MRPAASPAPCAPPAWHASGVSALLLLDTVDFPIAFWGAIRAGVVPVPINTLLTHEVVGYILADSRADALVISAPLVAPLLPVLHSIADLRRIIVAQPDGGTPAPIDDPRAVGLDEFLAGGDPATPTAVTPADEVAFWLYSSGSTGAPKGVRHVHGSLRATADTYGAQVLQIRADDLMFSAAKAFHAYGLGNCMTFPMSVGAGAVLLPDRPTPDAVMDTMQRHQPTIFAGVPTLFASMLANPRIGPGAGSAGCVAASPPARRCPPTSAGAGPTWWAWTSSTASAPPRCCTSSCPIAPTTSATARRASRCRATMR